VIGVPDEKWGETIKALVVLRPGAQASAADLIAFCRTRMAHYKCPTSIELRDAARRTAPASLQKFKLRSPTGPARPEGELTGRRERRPSPTPPATLGGHLCDWLRRRSRRSIEGARRALRELRALSRR